ncbi:hypothetical protein OHV05_30815 [Kitasatospora sp. NBC_00070]|uniref:hypothetical protein n=1 Tax=Kitasatospora sp. NBC_00070 TaxID=2975962 RepID=UPI003243CC82
MEEEPKFRPVEQVGTPLRRAVMEPQAAPLWGGGEDVVAAERSYERLAPVQGAAEPLFTPVERSSERLMPVQEAAEPLFSPVEQSAERMMPRQMHTMAAQDPFGTVTEARSSAAGAPEGTFPATRVGGFAPDGTTPALQVGAVAPEGTPAMQVGVSAGEGATAGLVESARRPASMQGLSAGSPSGGAGAGFVAIPEQYRAAAGPVLGVADQLKELYTSLSGYLHGMGANAPWGNDDDGKTFADGEDGEPGYLGNEKDILDGLKLLPKLVEEIGKNLKGMGDGYDSSEDFSLGTIGKPELPTPGTGQIDVVLGDIGNGKLNGRH